MGDSPTTPGAKAPRWAWWVATGFGSGYLKPAPGTWGSAAATLVWLGLRKATFRLPGGGPQEGWLWYGILPAMALTWLAIRASDAVVAETGHKDPSYIVADEWAGMWIALIPLWLLVPFKGPLPFWEVRALAPFLLFRLFDVWKPGVIHDLQSLPAGRGIVMDDVLAGIYAAIGTVMIFPFLGRP